jgi:ADP-ribose pyrophosphatase
MTPAHWQTLSSRTVLDIHPWLAVVEDHVRLPSGRIVNDFYRIKMPDYVLVAARHEDGRFLMERHFKQCLGREILTSPAGGIDCGETPLAAARRELLEETGYEAERFTSLGAYTVDGTRGLCSAHLFLAEGLKKVAAPLSNDMEEMELVHLSAEHIRSAVSSGLIPLLPDIALLSLIMGSLLEDRTQGPTP